mmetsp:Transcript_36157/g.101885  ORF Transcript_36157/g.101885 Transcript_36157/m.101885 type:complete len:255 (-) Transcript_36157:1483-2247(-)
MRIAVIVEVVVGIVGGAYSADEFRILGHDAGDGFQCYEVGVSGGVRHAALHASLPFGHPALLETFLELLLVLWAVFAGMLQLNDACEAPAKRLLGGSLAEELRIEHGRPAKRAKAGRVVRESPQGVLQNDVLAQRPPVAEADFLQTNALNFARGVAVVEHRVGTALVAGQIVGQEGGGGARPPHERFPHDIERLLVLPAGGEGPQTGPHGGLPLRGGAVDSTGKGGTVGTSVGLGDDRLTAEAGAAGTGVLTVQ